MNARCGLKLCQDDLGAGMVHFTSFIANDSPFSTWKTNARAHWYGVSGVPDVRVDGSRSVVGSQDCETNAGLYRQAIDARIAETEDVSPVKITGGFLPLADSTWAQATFELLDPAILLDLRATFFLYEDHVEYQGLKFNHVTRDIVDQAVVLAHAGDRVTVTASLALSDEWVRENLHVVAILQTASGDKQVIQTAFLPHADYEVLVPVPVASVRDAEGTATFEAAVTNTSDAPETVTLSDAGSFGSWWTDLRVCGGPDWTACPASVDLGPGDTCRVSARVHTDAARELRIGALQATSLTSGRVSTLPLKLFNGGPALVLVDDDGSGHGEVPIEAALDSLGRPYEVWRNADDPNGLGPSRPDLVGYEEVLWHTGLLNGGWPLLPVDIRAMESFIDGGGRLLLSTQEYFDAGDPDPEFTRDYLGASSWVVDFGYLSVVGVAGDPIGDGLAFRLDVPPEQCKDDLASPGPTATTFLTTPYGSEVGLRNQPALGRRVIFLPWALYAMQSDTDPQVLATFLGRCLGWLDEAPTAGAPDATPAPADLAHLASLAARPNPFAGRTSIEFRVDGRAADGPVTLVIRDLAGRTVARLLDGRVAPGPHARVWTGISDHGRAAPSGVYLATLATNRGTVSRRIVLLR